MNKENDCNNVKGYTLEERHAEYEVGFESGFREGAWTVWEWCEHYLVAKEDGGEIPVEELKKLFRVEHFGEILSNYDPFTAMSMTEAYDIHIGDVGTVHVDDKEQVVVIIRINNYEDKKIVHCITRDGRVLGCSSEIFKPLYRQVNLEEFFNDDEIWDVKKDYDIDCGECQWK